MQRIPQLRRPRHSRAASTFVMSMRSTSCSFPVASWAGRNYSRVGSPGFGSRNGGARERTPDGDRDQAAARAPRPGSPHESPSEERNDDQGDVVELRLDRSRRVLQHALPELAVLLRLAARQARRDSSLVSGSVSAAKDFTNAGAKRTTCASSPSPSRTRDVSLQAHGALAAHARELAAGGVDLVHEQPARVGNAVPDMRTRQGARP